MLRLLLPVHCLRCRCIDGLYNPLLSVLTPIDVSYIAYMPSLKGTTVLGSTHANSPVDVQTCKLNEVSRLTVTNLPLPPPMSTSLKRSDYFYIPCAIYRHYSFSHQYSSRSPYVWDRGRLGQSHWDLEDITPSPTPCPTDCLGLYQGTKSRGRRQQHHPLHSLC